MNNKYPHLSPSVAQVLLLEEQLATEYVTEDELHKAEYVKDQLALSADATQNVTSIISKFHSNWHVVSSITSGITFAQVGFSVLNVILVPILALVEKIKRRQLYQKTGDLNQAIIPAENKKNYLQNFLISAALFALVIPTLLLPAIAPVLAMVAGAVGLIGGITGLIVHATQVKQSQKYITDTLNYHKNSVLELHNMNTDELSIAYERSLNKKIEDNIHQIKHSKNELDAALIIDSHGTSKYSLTRANQLNQLIVKQRELKTQQKMFAEHKATVQYKRYTGMFLGVMLGLGALILVGVALTLFPPFALAVVAGFSIAGVATVATIGFVATQERLKKWWTQRFIPQKIPIQESETVLSNPNMNTIKPCPSIQFLQDEYDIKLNRYSNAVIIKEHYANQHLIDTLIEINRDIGENRLPKDFMLEAINDEPSLQQSINTAWYAVYSNNPQDSHPKLKEQFQHIINVLPKLDSKKNPEKEDNEGRGKGKQRCLPH